MVPLDDDHKLVIVASLVLVGCFHALLTLYPTRKQRAWILTAIGSATFTISSIPFVVHLIAHRGDLANLVRIPWWSDAGCRIFQANLLADLVVGSFYYVEHIDIVTGWGHHIVYLIMIDYCVRQGWSHIFALAGLMDLPTFHLSIATLHPKLRHNVLFAVTFFATRIAFHLGLFVTYASKATRIAAVGGSFVPACLFAATFPMHAIWFIGCIKGFIRRSNAQQRDAALASANDGKHVQPIVLPENSSSASLLAVPDLPLKATMSTFDSVPSDITPHSLPRVIAVSTSSTRARSRSSSSTTTTPAIPRSSPPVIRRSSPEDNVVLSYRPPLMSAERKESIRRLVGAVAGLADEVIAASPAVQSAVAVGRGMARRYNEYRDRTNDDDDDGLRQRNPPWRRSTPDVIEAY